MSEPDIRAPTYTVNGRPVGAPITMTDLEVRTYDQWKDQIGVSVARGTQIKATFDKDVEAALIAANVIYKGGGPLP